MLAYLKYILAGLFVASLIILGWTANGWRLKAQEAEGARLELRNEMQRRVEADKQRLAMQVKLSEAEARIGTGVRVVTKTIREYVQTNHNCDLADPVARGLQDLRRNSVSSAPSETTGSRSAAR